MKEVPRVRSLQCARLCSLEYRGGCTLVATHFVHVFVYVFWLSGGPGLRRILIFGARALARPLFVLETLNRFYR